MKLMCTSFSKEIDPVSVTGIPVDSKTEIGSLKDLERFQRQSAHEINIFRHMPNWGRGRGGWGRNFFAPPPYIFFPIPPPEDLKWNSFQLQVSQDFSVILI